MIAHLCPRCIGEKQIIVGIGTTQAMLRDCPTCNGEGVVWQTELKDITTHRAGDALRKSSAGESN